MFWQQKIAQEIATKLLYSCAPLRALWCLKNVTIDLIHAAKDLPIAVEARAEINNNPQWCVNGSNKDSRLFVSWNNFRYMFHLCCCNYHSKHHLAIHQRSHYASDLFRKYVKISVKRFHAYVLLVCWLCFIRHEVQYTLSISSVLTTLISPYWL